MKKYQQQIVKEQFCHCKKCDGILTRFDIAVADTLYPTEKGYCMDCLTSGVRDIEPFQKHFLRTFLQFLTPAFLIAELLFLFLTGLRHGSIFFFSDLLGNGDSVSLPGIILDVAILILGLAGWIYSIVQLATGNYFSSFVQVKFSDISTVSTSYSLDSNDNINIHRSEGTKRIYDKGDIAHNVFSFLFNIFLLLFVAAIGPVLFLVLNIVYAVKYCKIRTSAQKFFTAKKMAKQYVVHMNYCSDISSKSYDKKVMRLDKQYSHLTKNDREARMRQELPERHYFLTGENERYAVVGILDRGFLDRIFDLDRRLFYMLVFTVREKEDGSREHKAFLATNKNSKCLLCETENTTEISEQTIQSLFPEYTREYEDRLLKALASSDPKYRCNYVHF